MRRRQMTPEEREALVDLRVKVREELGVDISAEKGWEVRVTVRKGGVHEGKPYKEFFPPGGKVKLRSVKEVCAYVRKARGMAIGKEAEKKRKVVPEVKAKVVAPVKANVAGGGKKGGSNGASTAATGLSVEEEEKLEYERFVRDVKQMFNRDIRRDGWSVAVTVRKTGKLKGQTYKEFLTPCGSKLRSFKEVITYLNAEGPISKKNRVSDEQDDDEDDDGPTQAELDEMERKMAAAHAAAITRAAPSLPETTQSCVVQGLELDENMDEDRLIVEFMNITGFEPAGYDTVEQLRQMVDKELARAAFKGETTRQRALSNLTPPRRRSGREIRSLSYQTERYRRMKTTGGQPNKALVLRVKEAARESFDASKAGDVSRADWRGEGRVPKFLGNTSVTDDIRGGTRAGAAPKIAGTDAEIKLLPRATSAPSADVENRPLFDATDARQVMTLKAAMHTSSSPEEAKCREAERAKVIDLIQGCLRDRKPGSLYLAGLPGTGKTLTLKEVQRTTEKWGIAGKSRPKVAYINCMSLRDPKAIFGVILEELGETAHATDLQSMNNSMEFSDFPEVVALRRIMTESNSKSGGGMCIVLLDEMDQLLTTSKDVLYELFALPALKDSKCILAGVSNAINLTDRVLPILRARGCEPALVSFAAYDGAQLKVLLKQRLASLPFKAMEDSAIELCSRKVGAATGDMRKALNVCATAIDLCVQEATRPTDDGSDQPAPAPGIVKISHMARALSKTYASPIVDSIRALPQMQQMVLCSAVKLLKNAKTMETTLGALHDRYVLVCKSAGVRELSQGDFHTMCSALADHCLLKIGNGNNDRLRKVRMLVTEDDVIFSLQGVNFFRNLLGVSA
jgi:cell division control protein 6